MVVTLWIVAFLHSAHLFSMSFTWCKNIFLQFTHVGQVLREIFLSILGFDCLMLNRQTHDTKKHYLPDRQVTMFSSLTKLDVFHDTEFSYWEYPRGWSSGMLPVHPHTNPWGRLTGHLQSPILHVTWCLIWWFATIKKRILSALRYTLWSSVFAFG